MAWPERISSGVQSLDLFAIAHLDFERPDLARFPCLRLAYAAIAAGGTAPAILNAANEIAVQAFLAEQLPFRAIPRVIEDTLARVDSVAADTLETVLTADLAARAVASELLREQVA
jgi:1-deoxy-D-xylulose-5-phosphate reductoisomerase